MIDGDRLRRRREKLLRANAGNSGNNSQDKYFSGHRRRMIMRKTAVVVTRSALVVICVRMGMVVGMRHAIRHQRNLRMLQGVRHRGHGQQGQAGEPPSAETTATEHSADSNPPPYLVKPLRRSPCLREAFCLPELVTFHSFGRSSDLFALGLSAVCQASVLVTARGSEFPALAVSP